MTEVNLGSSGSVIKSIQRVTVMGDGSLTIAEVNPEKTIINLLTSFTSYASGGSSISRDSRTVSIWLINSTTVGHLATGIGSQGSYVPVRLYAEVIEYV